MMIPFMNVIKNVGYIAICIIGANYAIKGKITIGNIQAFIQYTNQFTHPLVQIANIFNMIQSTIASAERVFEILDEKEESKEVESNIDISKIRGNVECKNVEFCRCKRRWYLIDELSEYPCYRM